MRVIRYDGKKNTRTMGLPKGEEREKGTEYIKSNNS